MSNSDSQYVVAVTGANRGLGFNFVKKLLEGSSHVPFVPSDCVVVAAVRNPDGATKLHELQAQYAGRLEVLPLDQASEESVEKFATLFGEKFTHLNMLICNAGTIEEDPAANTVNFSKSSAMSIFAVNSVGPLLVTNALIKYLNAAHILAGGEIQAVTMDPNGGSDGNDEEDEVTETTETTTLTHKKGMYKPKKTKTPKPTHVRVVYISSSMGSIGAVCNSNVPTYRASKAALNMYIRCLSFDHPHLAFIPLHPGWVQTDMGSRGNRTPPTTVDESIDGCLKQIGKLTVENANKAMYSHDDTTWVW